MIETHSITILLPLFNEEGLLPEALLRIHEFAVENIADYEMLIIESGSTDKTGPLCDAVAAATPGVRVIHEGRRNGFGSALRRGYEAASKDWIWLVTADTPFDLTEIYNARRHFDSCDFILSYRSNDPRGWRRRLQSLIYNAIVKLALGLSVRHVNSAFKVLRRTALRQIPLTSSGWFIDAELLYWIQRLGYPFVELPVALLQREGGTTSVGALTFFDVLRELAEFLVTARKRRNGPGSAVAPRNE